ncbi:MAG: hypothetical protein ACOC44_09470 [Promethearchaeia archaeon]
MILPISALSIEYTLEVSEEDGFIWKVDTFKEEIYNTYFSEEADFIQGVQEKKVITRIQEKGDYWEVSYDYWNYTLNTDKLTEEADSEETYTIYKDPAVQANNTYTVEDILNMWLIPTPFTNYLTEYRDNFNSSYIVLTSSDNGVRYSISPVNYEIQIQYGFNGVAENIKYTESDGNVFVEIGLYTEVIHAYTFFPLYLSLFIGISCLLIYVKGKKRKKS